jgi:hypothetical protein
MAECAASLECEPRAVVDVCHDGEPTAAGIITRLPDPG